MTEWGPKTCIAILVGSVAFVVAGVWIVASAVEPETRLNGIAAIAFFAGGIPLSVLEMRRHARRSHGSPHDTDRIFGIAASRLQTLVLALTAAGMAFGSFMIQYIRPERPFIGTAAWVGTCFFGLAAIVLILLGLRSRSSP
jgi:Na+/H+ antiporter NhaC